MGNCPALDRPLVPSGPSEGQVGSTGAQQPPGLFWPCWGSAAGHGSRRRCSHALRCTGTGPYGCPEAWQVSGGSAAWSHCAGTDSSGAPEMLCSRGKEMQLSDGGDPVSIKGLVTRKPLSAMPVSSSRRTRGLCHGPERSPGSVRPAHSGAGFLLVLLPLVSRPAPWPELAGPWRLGPGLAQAARLVESRLGGEGQLSPWQRGGRGSGSAGARETLAATVEPEQAFPRVLVSPVHCPEGASVPASGALAQGHVHVATGPWNHVPVAVGLGSDGQPDSREKCLFLYANKSKQTLLRRAETGGSCVQL